MAKTGCAVVVSACCMLAKSIFFPHSKQKKVRTKAQIFDLSSNDTQVLIYECRFGNLQGCNKIER